MMIHLPVKIWNWANYFYGLLHVNNIFKLRKYKNIHKGERCFVIGNGPSLKISDLEKLKNEKIMVANSIFKIFNDLSYIPSYYFLQDNKVILNNKDALNKMSGFTKFVRAHYAKRYHVNGATYFCMLRNERKFSKHIPLTVYSGQTVTYTMIQFAAYMGFKEIYLLGVDFDYGQDNTAITQQSYFDKRLFDSTAEYHAPELDSNLIAYNTAKRFCDQHHIKICNATRGGKLEVFERVNFDDIL